MRLKSHLNNDISLKSPVLFLILGLLVTLASLYFAWFHYNDPYGCDPYQKFCSFANSVLYGDRGSAVFFAGAGLAPAADVMGGEGQT